MSVPFLEYYIVYVFLAASLLKRKIEAMLSFADFDEPAEGLIEAAVPRWISAGPGEAECLVGILVLSPYLSLIESYRSTSETIRNPYFWDLYFREVSARK